MTDVWSPLLVDIEKLRSEFTSGYRKGSACFYVGIMNSKMEETVVSDAIRASWSPFWLQENDKFETRLSLDHTLQKYKNHMFYVWDGNHRHKPWYPIINNNHADDPTFHVPVRSIVFNVTAENRIMLLNAMNDWNK